MSKKVEVSTESPSITIMTNCYACVKIGDKCPECQEEFDNNQTILAHQLVDEGSLTESPRPMSWLVDMPSGHDWIGSLVKLKDGSIRQEFLDPVVSMEDRVFEQNLEVMNKEVICTSCHLVCWAQLPCPNCDQVNPW